MSDKIQLIMNMLDKAPLSQKKLKNGFRATVCFVDCARIMPVQLSGEFSVSESVV